MNEARKSRRRLYFVLCPLPFVLCLFILHPSSFILAAELPPADPAKSDAQLADVCFVDPQHGWAVGDRGVIWHTDDGGAKWQLQNSTVDCRLSSVQFLDLKNGWAAGGSTQPYTHATTGVVLRTTDGGQTWAAEPTWMLPAIDRIQFFDARRGCGVGRSSSLYPSGLFVTDRGGRDWVPLLSDAREFAAWSAADFVDARNGVLAGASGSMTLAHGSTLETGPSLGRRAARQIKLVDAKNGWLAGDGGLLLHTTDGGRTWQPSPGPLPKSAELFDFTSLEVRGNRMWLAGSPGSRVFTSEDGGRTWLDYLTSQAIPIRGLCFVDDDRGWAIGDLGTVLATRDGGRSWKRQQAGGSRTAILGIFCEADDIPLELFARLSTADGYLSRVAIVNRCDRDNSNLESQSAAARAHEAVTALGGVGADTAWQFPVRNRQLDLPAHDILARWTEAGRNGQAGGKASLMPDGAAQLETYLVRLIRTWRPDIIVTHDANPRGDDPLAYLITQATIRAVEAAGAATDTPQTADALEPWTVKKVYGVLPQGQGGLNVAATEMAPRSGRSLAELTWQARGLIHSEFSTAPPSMGFRTLVNRLPQEAGRGDFLTGIPDGRGESRRRLADAPHDNIDALRRAAQKRRNLQAILARSAQDPTAAARWMGSMADLTADLDETTAGEFTFQLAQRLFQSGHWELAAETFALLPKRYPKHPLTPAALVWLVQYYSSEEVYTRITAQPSFGLVPVAGQGPAHAGSAIIATSAETNLAQNATPDAAMADASQSQSKRATAATGFAEELEKIAPGAFAEPKVRCALAASARGSDADTDKFLSPLRRGRPQDAWFAAAQGEQWLMKRRGPPPKKTWLCTKTTLKPRLDGKLDDPIWEQAKSIDLHSPQKDDDAWPASAMLTYDGEFLYLAVRCRRAPGVQYTPPEGTRGRDADLSKQDRIDLLIDIDRDYGAFYRLSIDQRGWTADECWGDASWNPNWYVAAGSDEDSWTIEAAIPLAELSRHPPDGQTVWGVGVQRIVPGVGFQSWTTPASPDGIPEGFGYLTFGESGQ